MDWVVGFGWCEGVEAGVVLEDLLGGRGSSREAVLLVLFKGLEEVSVSP